MGITVTEYTNIEHDMVHQVKVGDVFNLHESRPDDCRRWYIPKLEVLAIAPYDDGGRADKEFRVRALEDGNWYGDGGVEKDVEYKLNPHGLWPIA